jgi:class 3 adenylate cyclase
MVSERLPRKLTAILYADVAGYSRLTGEDEEGTHRTLRTYLDDTSTNIQQHEGRIVHYAGDAVLADFGTVVDALSCAAAIQRNLKERNTTVDEGRRVQFRIGVNLGDVIVDGEEIYGDGVNVAARLESLADPGGICISESVRAAVGKKLALDYEFMGEQQVKNITEPIRAYRVLLDGVATARAKKPKHRQRRSIAIAAVIVIAVGTGVLTWFLSREPEQEAVSSPQAGLSAIPRGAALTTKPTLIKAGRLNIKLALPSRWDAHVITQGPTVSTGSEFGVPPSPQIVMATDREGTAHFEVLKLIVGNVGSKKAEGAHAWMQNEGVKLLLSRYAGGSYREQRGVTTQSVLGSGEDLTILSSALDIGDERRHVKIAYVVRGKTTDFERLFIVFFFHNKKKWARNRR